jgi:hypothetical protein
MASPSDSASAPELPAPRKRRPRWLIVIVGPAVLLIVAGGWTRWTQRPLARIPLPHGGELLLLEAHYGPTVHVAEQIGWRERFSHWLPTHRSTPFPPAGEWDFGFPDDPPRLWLIFTSTRADNEQTLYGITGIVPLQDGLALDEAISQEYGYNPGRQMRVAVGLASYPRRARELQLRIVMAHQIVAATIRNPFPITDVPLWTPQPIPQSRPLKSGEVVLKSLGRESESMNVVGGSFPSFRITAPEIEVHQPGILPTAIDVDATLSDATDNESYDRLPAAETAWKIHAVIRPNEQYPFPGSEIESVGRATVPAPGEYSVCALPTDAPARGIRQAVLVSAGWWRVNYNNGLTVKSIPPSISSVTQPTPPGIVVIQSYNTELLVLGRGRYFDDQPPKGALYIVRAMRGTDSFFKMWEQRRFTANDGSIEGYGFSLHETARVGTEVEIQSSLTHEESVDFFVRPPP